MQDINFYRKGMFDHKVYLSFNVSACLMCLLLICLFVYSVLSVYFDKKEDISKGNSFSSDGLDSEIYQVTKLIDEVKSNIDRKIKIKSSYEGLSGVFVEGLSLSFEEIYRNKKDVCIDSINYEENKFYVSGSYGGDLNVISFFEGIRNEYFHENISYSMIKSANKNGRMHFNMGKKSQLLSGISYEYCP